MFHAHLEDLRGAITDAWAGIPRDIIMKTGKSFRSRLEACIVAEGSHFEHTQNKFAYC